MRKFLIKVNGTQYDVEVEEVLDYSTAVMKPVKDVKAEVPKLASASTALGLEQKESVQKMDNSEPEGVTLIFAPMPGTILNVAVNVGDTVKKGQVLLILEAMKMENEIIAPVDGRVAAVNVERGKAVNLGDFMVSLA